MKDKKAEELRFVPAQADPKLNFVWLLRKRYSEKKLMTILELLSSKTASSFRISREILTL